MREPRCTRPYNSKSANIKLGYFCLRQPHRGQVFNDLLKYEEYQIIDICYLMLKVMNRQ